jgi:hypothetical protein
VLLKTLDAIPKKSSPVATANDFFSGCGGAGGCAGGYVILFSVMLSFCLSEENLAAKDRE